MLSESTYPVGSRVIIRDAEWRILQVDQTAHAGARLKCVGLSELVRGKVAFFFERYEKPNSIVILKPEGTRLLEDHSPNFLKSKLYLEALFRKAPKTDPEKIEVAHKAAMDPLPYQFDPALQALKQPRARILIADAVGIGKTLEAGILTSELIARGRGRRILVVATKAMLNQFQQEFWNRFSIPLVALDSAGIQKIRNRIPTNHNPFLYFDRSIISIDTLKSTDQGYLPLIENAHWDIIIIDEAHNVAERNTRSLRSKIAKVLANCSDTMIMLSATPHDGKPESFASLMNILDPTAIVNTSKYSLADFADKGLVIRRFKGNIRAQVKQEFPDREISIEKVAASPEEEAVYNALASLEFGTLDSKKATGARLFATTLTKAFFSSPDACASVIENRLKKLAQEETAKTRVAGSTPASERPAALSKLDEFRVKVHQDSEKLKQLQTLVKNVKPAKFSKLQHLAQMLKGDTGSIGWNLKDTEDRLVIFTESIVTLRFLEKHLPRLIGLEKDQYLTMSGEMSEDELSEAQNEFNKRNSEVRLLLCSDVASEGINLHHLSHRMIHFDVPWSLLTFQQRNGRIDRYGQTKVPQIKYLITESINSKVKGDTRVLEKLIDKDKQAQENLSDPAEFSLSEEEGIARTAADMEGHLEPLNVDDIFTSFFNQSTTNDSQSLNISPVLSAAEYEKHLAKHRSLFVSPMAFAKDMLRHLASAGCIRKNSFSLEEDHRILLEVPKDLEARLKYMPAEVRPEGERFDLTDDVTAVQKEMERARSSDSAWPKQTLLWELHPVMSWLEDRAQDLFGRHAAPLLRMNAIPQSESWALLQGGYPNLRGFIPIFDWVVVREKDGVITQSTLDELITSLNLDHELSNNTRDIGTEPDCREEFSSFVKKAVTIAYETLAQSRARYEATDKAKLLETRDRLKKLKNENLAQLELNLEDSNPGGLQKTRAEAHKDYINRCFDDAMDFILNTAETKEEPFLQLVAVFSSTAQ